MGELLSPISATATTLRLKIEGQDRAKKAVRALPESVSPIGGLAKPVMPEQKAKAFLKRRDTKS
jgi:hypothetical protein